MVCSLVCDKAVFIAAPIDGWSAGALDLFDMYDVLVLMDLALTAEEDAKLWIGRYPPPPETLGSVMYSHRGVVSDKFTHLIARSSLRYDWGKCNKLTPIQSQRYFVLQRAYLHNFLIKFLLMFLNHAQNLNRSPLTINLDSIQLIPNDMILAVSTSVILLVHLVILCPSFLKLCTTNLLVSFEAHFCPHQIHSHPPPSFLDTIWSLKIRSLIRPEESPVNPVMDEAKWLWIV